MPNLKIAIVPVTVFQQNCSLVWDPATRRAAVIDPGGEPGKILSNITRLGLKVELILLTHGHLDHAGGAKALKGELDQSSAAPIPILGPHVADKYLLDSIEEAQKSYNMSGLRSVTPDRFLTEGEVIELGPLRFDVLHVPGHSPGHIAFIEQTERVAFVGDTVFKQSVGRTDLPFGDHSALIAGIKGKLLPLGDDITFFPGHGEPSTFGAERQTNPFLQD